MIAQTAARAARTSTTEPAGISLLRPIPRYAIFPLAQWYGLVLHVAVSPKRYGSSFGFLAKPVPYFQSLVVVHDGRIPVSERLAVASAFGYSLVAVDCS
jgi:hypothetical protein